MAKRRKTRGIAAIMAGVVVLSSFTTEVAEDAEIRIEDSRLKTDD
jgi:hypothetical protein